MGRVSGWFRRGVILLDKSGLLAATDGGQHQHAEAVAALRQASAPLLLSPFVLAELDYLLATRLAFAPNAQCWTKSREVVFAERYAVWDVLTLDHRHFHALRGPGRRHFRLLPSA